MTASQPNPYDAPNSAPAAVDWRTWSPFQSQNTRDICANMTPEEKSTVTRRGLLYGLWVVVSVALPLQFIFMGIATGSLNPVVAAVGGLLVIAHLIGIPIWQRKQRQFLCNTLWARTRGIQPDSLKLFRFGRAQEIEN